MPLKGEHPTKPTYAIGSAIPAGPNLGVVTAYHDVFRRDCVQKTVALQGLNDSVYRNEPQLARDLSHPHVVEIWEAQHDPSIPDAVTFTMPHYRGGSVKDALEQGHLFSIYDAIKLCSHLLDALSYVHDDLRFVHRDVKPGNLLLNAARSAGFLSDFGSAARMDAAGHVITSGFTPAYLDPSAAVSGQMTAASDVYSAGLVLFEMLSGPIDWAKLDPAKAQARLISGQRPMPTSWLSYSPHVPGTLRRVVNKAIREDVAGRFKSAADMATKLSKIRAIDWKHTSGTGLKGEWQGKWPPGKGPSQQRTYRVTARPLNAGKSKGQLRLEADYKSPTTAWRGFGVSDSTVARQDARAVAQFFSQIELSVAHNKAAR